MRIFLKAELASGGKGVHTFDGDDPRRLFAALTTFLSGAKPGDKFTIEIDE